MKINLTYLRGLIWICLLTQLLASCEAWEMPKRKTQRDCVKPAGTIDAQSQQRQVDFSIGNSAGTIDAISWNFGNGSTTVTTGITPVKYTYPTSGTYVVTASLTNSCDNGTTIQRTIEISDAVPPTVTLQPITDVTTSAANARITVTSTGNATITRYGVCYSPSNQTPEVDKDITISNTGPVTSNVSIPFSLTGLQSNTQYYVRSFAINTGGRTGYSSSIQTFRTGYSAAVSTNGAASIGVTTASVNFVLNNPGNPAAVQYGVIYSSISSTPDLNNSAPGVIVSSPNLGVNTVVNLTNLTANTKYYYRSYAKLPSGEIIYGTIESLTTQVDTVVQDLIAHLTFTNGSLLDGSGNNNHANPVNSPTFTADRKGVANSAILFDGKTNYIYLSDNTSLQPDALSISVWIKPIAIKNVNNRVQIYNKSRWNDSSAEMYSSLIKLNENGPGLTFMTNIKQNSNCVPAKGWENFEFSSNFQLNTWHHLVFTYSNRSVRMYFDNILVDQRDNLPAFSIDKCPGGELKFGAQLRDYPNYFDGAMDDIRIYKRALSASDVETLFKQ